MSARLIGGHPLLAGLIVSLVAFLLALIYFWRWTADRLGADVATGAVWLLSAFPLGVFFSAAYTESLYLLIVVAACYYAERRQFARSAGAGFLAGLVRPNGLLLSIPIAWTAFFATTSHDRTEPRRPQNPLKKRLVLRSQRPRRFLLLVARSHVERR